MKHLLAIETSSDVCSICVQAGEKQFSFHKSIPRQHAKRVLPEIELLLEKAGLKISDLEGIVYGAGPGSFTGIRIASGVAQGLSLALDVPVFAVPTLTALATAVNAKPGQWVLPAVDARMNQVYWWPHKINESGVAEPVGEPMALDPDQVSVPAGCSEAAAIGTGWQLLHENEGLKTAIKTQDESAQPSALEMIRWLKMASPEPQSAGQVEPLYVRNKVTWDQKPKVGSV